MSPAPVHSASGEKKKDTFLPNRQDAPLLALDIGGTKLAAGLAVQGGRSWLAYDRRPTPTSAAETVRVIIELARTLVAQDGSVAAVGVSFGGPVDAATGVVRRSQHVPGWDGFPLVKTLQAYFAAPTALLNDGDAAALGEWSVDPHRPESLLYVTVSTGIGSGWILRGALYSGASGMAGEIGHLPLGDPTVVCGCGHTGCLETVASGTAISRIAQRDLRDSGRAVVEAAHAAGAGRITAEAVSRAAAGGDPGARAILEDAGRKLGQALGTAILLMNPQRIVLGGGVTRAGVAWWAAVRDEACRTALTPTVVDIAPTRLGDDAPLWGAARAAERLHSGITA